jgi:hypothetical protein
LQVMTHVLNASSVNAEKATAPNACSYWAIRFSGFRWDLGGPDAGLRVAAGRARRQRQAAADSAFKRMNHRFSSFFGRPLHRGLDGMACVCEDLGCDERRPSDSMEPGGSCSRGPRCSTTVALPVSAISCGTSFLFSLNHVDG